MLACKADDKCSGRSNVHAGSLRIDGSKGHELSALECVEFVGGDVQIDKVDDSSLAALSSLVYVEGNLEIDDMPNLTSLKDLAALQHVSGYLSVSRNPKLKSLAGLDALSEVEGALFVQGNDKLASLDGLAALRRIGGDWWVTDNAALKTLAPPKNLDKLVGQLWVTNNHALESVDWPALPGVSSVYISENNALRTVAVPPPRPTTRLTCMDGHPEIYIGDNKVLSSVFLPLRLLDLWGCAELASNPQLESVSGDGAMFTGLNIWDSPKLTKLDLSGAILRELSLRNTGLTSLKGLGDFNVRCTLDVTDNAKLTSLGLDPNELHVDRWLNISGNPKLPACAAQAIADGLAPAYPLDCSIPDMDDFPSHRDVDVSHNDAHGTCGPVAPKP